MLRSNIILAFRNIIRHASNSTINISGIALGITCALLIFSLVTYHLSFDNFHDDSHRIYRFVTEEHRDEVSYVGSVPPGFAKAFRDDYTFGEKLARLAIAHEALITVQQANDKKKFIENAAFAEPDYFEIFDFPLASGVVAGTQANTAILTEKMAKKFFGKESPLDQTIRFNNSVDFKIVGVLKDIPDNTDLRHEIYLSYGNIRDYSEWYASESWGGISSELLTFAKLREGVEPIDVEKVLPDYVKRYRPTSKNVHHYKLQPLSDIHFNENYGGVIARSTLIVLSVIGFFLVFTACLNFINLSTAQAVTRSKEIGVRKTLGSARMQLFWQFALETGMIVTLATFIALAVAYSVVPFINELFDARMQFDLLQDQRLMLFIPGLMIVVTLLSCSYPGMVLSGFKPAQALKGKFSGKQNFNLRRSLITVQFTISQVLLICLIAMVLQMHYFKSTDMGYDQEAIVMIPSGSYDEKIKTLKDRFEQIPNVQSVTSCFASPASENRWGTSLVFENRTAQEDFSVSFRGGDKDFIKTFGLKLVAGRNLEPSDTVREFVVNETLVSKLNQTPEEILGKNLRINGSWAGPVVGVVRDFHDQSLHGDISPVVIASNIRQYHTYAVKINMQNSKETLQALERSWSEMYPELLYTYQFLDEETAEFYQTEETMLQLIEVFAFIALFIGCMGLYGMASFMSLQKTKEIGIRKVLGGSISHILWIFGKEFARLIIIAFVIAAPIGWYLMSRWLENFAYRIELTSWIFLAEVAFIATLVLFTVGYKALRTALMNPVRALRTE
jgi:putative ABC transport system permease protein